MDKTLGAAANLAQLLPTGTVFAFQALSSSFTNRGTCHTSNKCLTVILIALSTISVFFFAITDSFRIPERSQKVYYGIAKYEGFHVLNYDNDEVPIEGERLHALRLRPRDIALAVISCLVFLALALDDLNVQRCFTLLKGVNGREMYKNLPLGVGLLATFVFSIFPTSRNGIGYSVRKNTRLPVPVHAPLMVEPQPRSHSHPQPQSCTGGASTPSPQFNPPLVKPPLYSPKIVGDFV